MKNFPITEQEAVELVNSFINQELYSMIGSYLGSKAAKYAFEPEYVLYDQKEESWILKITKSMYRFATTGIWEGGAYGEEKPIFEAFLETTIPDYFQDSFAEDKTDLSKLSPILELADAREIVSPIDGYNSHNLDILQIAYLADMTPESVRVSRYAEGDKRLSCDEQGFIQVDEAKRWLTVKGVNFRSYIKITWDRCPKKDFYNLHELADFLKSVVENQSIDIDKIIESLPLDQQQKCQVLPFLSRYQGKPSVDLNWLSPEIAKELGSILKLDPSWIIEKLLITAARQRSNKISSELKTVTLNVEVKMEEVELSSVATAEKIGQFIQSNDSISRHPTQTKANAKMNGYFVADSGRTFTHEHSLKTQYLWCRTSDLDMHNLKSVTFTEYPSNQVGLDGRYGRHSGLKKYKEMADADLIKITLRTMEDLKVVLESLSVLNI